MALPACPYRVSETGYTVTRAADVRLVPLLGGGPRVRRDTTGGWDRVTCQWTAGPAKYETLLAWFEDDLVGGSGKFTIDLLLRQGGITNHEALIVPGSFEPLGQVEGYRYIVRAELAVDPRCAGTAPVTTWPGTKWAIAPDQESYRATRGPTAIASEIAPAPRQRANPAGAWDEVACLWKLGAADYTDLHAFVSDVLGDGAQPFTIDLLMKQRSATTHRAYLLPGTLKLARQAQETFIVEAQFSARREPEA